MGVDVNKVTYDFGDLRILLANQEPFGIEEVNYSDELDIKVITGKGGLPRGWSSGDYAGSGNVVLHRDEADRLRRNLGGSYYPRQPFPITCQYGQLSQNILTDVLPQVKFVKTGVSNSKGGDRAGDISLDFVLLAPIKWNDLEAFLSILANLNLTF